MDELPLEQEVKVDPDATALAAMLVFPFVTAWGSAWASSGVFRL